MNLVLQLLKLTFESLNGISLFTLFLLSKHHILIKKVSLAHLSFDSLFILVNLSPQIIILLVDLEQLDLRGTEISIQITLANKQRGVLLIDLGQQCLLGLVLMSDILELLLDLVTDQLFFLDLHLNQLDRLQLLVPLLVAGLRLFVEGLLLTLADLKQLRLLLELQLRIASVIAILLHTTLLVLEDLALLLNLLTQENGLVVETLLLTLFINLLLLGLLDLLA